MANSDVSSEPTASALIGIFNELAKAPHYVEELYAEIKDLDLQDSRMLEKPPLLNGVINEGLRLYPALFTGGARKTTANGAVIGGVFLPPHTTIIAPRFSISRRKFSRPPKSPAFVITHSVFADPYVSICKRHTLTWHPNPRR